MYVKIRKMYHHPTLYFLCMYVVIGDYEHDRILASERTGLQQLEILGEMKEIINMPLITPVLLSSIHLVTATIPNSFPWARAQIRGPYISARGRRCHAPGQAFHICQIRRIRQLVGWSERY